MKIIKLYNSWRAKRLQLALLSTSVGTFLDGACFCIRLRTLQDCCGGQLRSFMDVLTSFRVQHNLVYRKVRYAWTNHSWDTLRNCMLASFSPRFIVDLSKTYLNNCHKDNMLCAGSLYRYSSLSTTWPCLYIARRRKQTATQTQFIQIVYIVCLHRYCGESPNGSWNIEPKAYTNSDQRSHSLHYLVQPYTNNINVLVV